MTVSTPPALLARALVCLGLPLFAFLACGRKGAPLPPRPVTPAAVSRVRAEQRESAIVVTWARPGRNEDGTPLTDLLEFRIHRAVSTALPREGQAPPVLSLLATVRAEQPDNASVQGGLYAFRDDGGSTGLTPGVRYTYRVQAVNRRGDAGPPSVEAFVDFVPAPARPVGLNASAGDGVVDLAWQAPVGPGTEGSLPVRGYNVYRGVRSGEYASDPINARPLLDMQFRDTGVENETTYYYVVRSVGTERPPWRESPNSNEVSATSLDYTPPAPPRGLVAIPAPNAVALSWDANAESDLLGYLVYRRQPPTLTPVRLTEVPVRATTFTDHTARPGVSYVYTITAVDRSPRRNESAPSAEVPVSLP